MSSVFERRVAAEWLLLQELASRNPGRLTHLCEVGSAFSLQLHGPAAAPVHAQDSSHRIATHAMRIDFPVHFPAVPMEMFLQVPAVHPNIHPETGFVCLWDRHRVSNTVEHALHKLAAMLAGELQNGEALHVMQPQALAHPVRTESQPLLGVLHTPVPAQAMPSRRRRLQ